MVEMSRADLGLMMEAGYILVGMQRFKEAREVFEGINVLAPDSELPLVALASVDFCQGKFRDAIRKYKKAIKLNADSVFARAYLGESLFFIGKKEAAVDELTWVIKNDRDGKAGAFAQSLLDAVQQGFTPEMLSGVEDLKAWKEKENA